MTQTQDDKRHPLDHIFIGYRVSFDFNAQSDRSDIESDDADADADADAEDYVDDANEDICQFDESPGNVSLENSLGAFDR